MLLLISLLSALTGTLLSLAYHAQPELSPVGIGLARSVLNGLIALFAFRAHCEGSFSHPARNRRLIVWGIMGAITALTFNFAAQAIGAGKAAFLQSSYGVLLGVLSARLLGQRARPSNWISMFGAILGIYLIGKSGGHSEEGFLGALLALASGVSAALAYLALARSVSTIEPGWHLASWSLFSGISGLAVGLTSGIGTLHWPSGTMIWILVLASGLLASLAQYFTILSFRRVSVIQSVLAGFLAPGITFAADCAIQLRAPSASEILGVVLIFSSAWASAWPTSSRSSSEVCENPR